MIDLLTTFKRYASNFIKYMLSNPLKGSILLAAIVLGITGIIAASVLSGGSAPVVFGGLAGIFQGGSMLAGAITFCIAVAGSSLVALVYDVNKFTVMNNEQDRLKKANNFAPIRENKPKDGLLGTEDAKSAQPGNQFFASAPANDSDADSINHPLAPSSPAASSRATF